MKKECGHCGLPVDVEPTDVELVEVGEVIAAYQRKIDLLQAVMSESERQRRELVAKLVSLTASESLAYATLEAHRERIAAAERLADKWDDTIANWSRKAACDLRAALRGKSKAGQSRPTRA